MRHRIILLFTLAILVPVCSALYCQPRGVADEQSQAKSMLARALALGEINGPEAQKALEQASQTEQDEEVLRSIRIGLRRR